MSFKLLVSCLLIGTMALIGCQTAPLSPKNKATEADLAHANWEFIPANYISRVAFEEGQYQSLLSPKTFAVWVDGNIKEIKLAYENQKSPNNKIDEFLLRDAAYISEHYYIVECHIESSLPDSRIAYDVSSLRNMDIFLTTTKGANIYPLHHVIASSVSQTKNSALNKYMRTNLLIFPKKDFVNGESIIPYDIKTLRLYIKGYKTSYYHEWKPQEPIASPVEGEPAPENITDVIRWRPNQTETCQVLQMHFTEIYPKLQALTRMPKKDE
jgi:hypothetical protein